MPGSEFKQLADLLGRARASLLTGLRSVRKSDTAWPDLDDADRLLFAAMLRVERAIHPDSERRTPE